MTNPTGKDMKTQQPGAGEAMTKEEFLARFKARMLAAAGEKFDDGSSIAEYAGDIAATYWDDEEQRAEGPEECANSDMSYWGD